MPQLPLVSVGRLLLNQEGDIGATGLTGAAGRGCSLVTRPFNATKIHITEGSNSYIRARGAEADAWSSSRLRPGR